MVYLFAGVVCGLLELQYYFRPAVWINRYENSSLLPPNSYLAEIKRKRRTTVRLLAQSFLYFATPSV